MQTPFSFVFCKCFFKIRKEERKRVKQKGGGVWKRRKSNRMKEKAKNKKNENWVPCSRLGLKMGPRLKREKNTD